MTCPTCHQDHPPTEQCPASLRDLYSKPLQVVSVSEVRKQQDDRVVALLETALTDARSGKINGVVIVGVGDNQVGGSYAGRNLITAVGEMEAVKLRILVHMADKLDSR